MIKARAKLGPAIDVDDCPNWRKAHPSVPAMPRQSRKQMIEAFLASEAAADGSFVAAVKTTGIYCRPSCTARKPKRENIEIFDTPDAAQQCGYRPCKRCRPDRAVASLPEVIGRLTEVADAAAGQRLTDKALSSLGIDPSTARRQFRRHFGLTFHAYQRAARLAAASRHVSQGGRLLEAQLDSGFESDSGFRAAFGKAFGRSPKASSEGLFLCARPIPTPLGPILAVAGPKGLHLVDFLDREHIAKRVAKLRVQWGLPLVPSAHPVLDQLEHQLSQYFAGTRRTFDLPLAQHGTEWDHGVWRALQEIPYGETLSYSALAAKLGREQARRAVGRSNGMNPLCLVVPCHRVIAADGTLSGYSGGVWRKQWLLDHERRHTGHRDNGSSKLSGPASRTARLLPSERKLEPRRSAGRPR